MAVNLNIALCHTGVFIKSACLGRVAMRRRKTTMMSGWNRASGEIAGGGTGILPGGAD